MNNTQLVNDGLSLMTQINEHDPIAVGDTAVSHRLHQTAQLTATLIAPPFLLSSRALAPVPSIWPGPVGGQRLEVGRVRSLRFRFPHPAALTRAVDDGLSTSFRRALLPWGKQRDWLSAMIACGWLHVQPART